MYKDIYYYYYYYTIIIVIRHYIIIDRTRSETSPPGRRPTNV